MLSTNATDRDLGANGHIHYSIDSNLFVISQENGSIYTKSVIDREKLPNGRILMEVFAVDRGQNPLTGTATILIEVIGWPFVLFHFVNDNNFQIRN